MTTKIIRVPQKTRCLFSEKSISNSSYFMKNFLLALSACLFSLNSFSQEKTIIAKSSVVQPSDSIQGRPADFPKYIDSGNQLEDEKNYRLSKEKYMLEHFGTEKSNIEKNSQVENKSIRNREDAQKPKNIDDQGRKIISKEEFENYPQEKKDRILAQPSKFIIQ